MATEFFLREADSDVVGVRTLGPFGAAIEVQLDAALAPLADDFNRADSATLGANWTGYVDAVLQVLGMPSIRSNRVGATIADGSAFYEALYTAQQLAADQYAQATLADISGTLWEMNLMLRGDATAKRGYVFSAQKVPGGNFYIINRWASGQIVNLTSNLPISPAWAAGDVIRAEVVGSQLRFLRNGVVVHTLSDSGLAGVGYAGLGISADAAAAGIDDWSAGTALGQVLAFLTPPPLPGKLLWEAGNYTLTLEVVQGDGISYTAELWRTDKDGAEIAQIGSRPATQTGDGTKTFVFTGAEIATAKDDRLKVKILATNDTGAAATITLRCSASKLATPLGETRRPGSRARVPRFLGVVPRPGEPKPDPDGFVDL